MGAWSWGWRAAVVMGLALAVGRGVGAEPPAEMTPEQRKELEGKARALNDQAVALYRDGKYAEATELHRQALAMRRGLYPREHFPQGHPDLAMSINHLAFLHDSQGEYGKAEPLYHEALAMRRGLYPRERFPQGHPDL